MSIEDTMNNAGYSENSEFNEAENLKSSVYPENTTGGGVIVGGFDWKGFIFTPTGPEDDYLNHPLNFLHNEGLGQMIKGAMGFLSKYANINDLKLALIDITFGWLKLTKGVKGDIKKNE